MNDSNQSFENPPLLSACISPKLIFANRKEKNAYYKALARGQISNSNVEGTKSDGESVAEMNCDEELTFESKAAKKAYYKAMLGYPEPYCTFRDLTRDVWGCTDEEKLSKEEKIEFLKSVVHEMVGPSENPFKCILELHRSATDYGKGSSGISGLVLDFFAEWLEKRGDKHDLLEKYVDIELKKEAFRFGTEKQTSCLQKLSDIFVLREDSDISNYAREEIDNLCARHSFKEALEVVEFYKWHNKYSIEKFLIPCLLQDRHDLIHRFLEGKRMLQEELLKWLDEMMIGDERLNEIEINIRLKPYKDSKVMTAQISKFYMKSLKKTIKSLLTKFNLFPMAQRIVPNWARIQHEGDIKFNLRRRYDPTNEFPCSQQTFFDHVYPVVRNDRLLQRSLVISLLQTWKQVEDAVWWCEYLNMDTYDKPRDVKNFEVKFPREFERIRGNVMETKTRNSDATLKVKKFILEGEYCGKIIDTEEEIDELTKELFTETLIGVDSEWKPAALSAQDQVALLQVATSQAVYLVDFCVLENTLPSEKWKTFFEAMFTTESIKLGFDFINDVRAISTTIKELDEIKGRMKGIIDLKKLTDAMLDRDDTLIDMFDPSKPAASASISDGELQVERSFKLSFLYKQTTGCELDKSHQISNWAHRPLRMEQMRYAALDAYCLISIYNELRNRVMEKGYDFDAFLQQSDPFIPKEKKKKDKATKEDDMVAMLKLIEKINSSTLENVSTWKSSRDLKIIVDSMLRGLGKHLRRFGVDVLMPETKEEVKRMGMMHQDRVILSSGKSFTSLAVMASFKGRILCIPQAHNIDPADQAAIVFREFRVKPDVNDVFTRCMLCNASAFVLVPGPVIEFLFRYHVELNSIYAVERNFNHQEWMSRLQSITAEDHRGVGCSLKVDLNEDRMIVHCVKGVIDLSNNLVFSERLDLPTEILVKNVPPNVFMRPGWFYYVCGKCGKVYWDGGHQRNYIQKAQFIIDTSTADDVELVVKNSA